MSMSTPPRVCAARACARVVSFSRRIEARQGKKKKQKTKKTERGGGQGGRWREDDCSLHLHARCAHSFKTAGRERSHWSTNAQHFFFFSFFFLEGGSGRDKCKAKSSPKQRQVKTHESRRRRKKQRRILKCRMDEYKNYHVQEDDNNGAQNMCASHGSPNKD